jgi:toxin ParE1/3/4
MAGYHLSSRAEWDVLEIWKYIAKDNLAAADRLLDRFTDAFEQLSQFPESGQRYQDTELRQMTVSPYVILYQVSAGGVNIVRVVHSSRKWEALL